MFVLHCCSNTGARCPVRTEEVSRQIRKCCCSTKHGAGTGDILVPGGGEAEGHQGRTAAEGGPAEDQHPRRGEDAATSVAGGETDRAAGAAIGRHQAAGPLTAPIPRAAARFPVEVDRATAHAFTGVYAAMIAECAAGTPAFGPTKGVRHPRRNGVQYASDGCRRSFARNAERGSSHRCLNH